MNSSSFIFISSLLLVLFFHVGHVHGDATLVDETCKKTRDYSLCLGSLQSDPNSQTADLQGLAVISIELAIKNATSIESHIKSLLGSLAQPALKGPLEDCLELYSDALPEANEAIKTIQSKNYPLANTQLSGVSQASTTCEDGFEEAGLTSPVKNEDDVFFKLTGISIAITNLLKS